MPRGQPDYGLYTDTPVASGIADPGEAAARLGSINVYDRRGWTVWMDDFEAPALKWVTVTSVGGTDATLSTTRAWMGIQSVNIITAAVAAENSRIYRYFPLLRTGKLGIEFFLHLQAVVDGYFRLYVNIYDGINNSRLELLLDEQAQTATIVTAAGDVIVSTTAFNTVFYRHFVPIKIVVDMDNDRYTRLMIGSQEIDISAHALVIVGASAERMLNVDLGLFGNATGTQGAHLDSFILTQNEP